MSAVRCCLVLSFLSIACTSPVVETNERVDAADVTDAASSDASLPDAGPGNGRLSDGGSRTDGGHFAPDDGGLRRLEEDAATATASFCRPGGCPADFRCVEVRSLLMQCRPSIVMVVVGGDVTTAGGGSGSGYWTLLDAHGAPTTAVSASSGSLDLYEMDEEDIDIRPGVTAGQRFVYVGAEGSSELTKTFRFYGRDLDDLDGPLVLIDELSMVTGTNGTGSMVRQPDADGDIYLAFEYAADGSGIAADYVTAP